MPTFYDLLASTEGGGNFDTLFGHSQREGGRFSGVRPSQMTLAELQKFEDEEYGPWSKDKLGYKATPVGLSQIVGQTRRGLAKEMGLGDDALFDEETQRAMTRRLLDQTGGDLNKLRGTWEGFKGLSDEDLKTAWENYQGTGSIGMGGQMPVTAGGDGSIARGDGQRNAGIRQSPRPEEAPPERKRPPIFAEQHAALTDKFGIDEKRQRGLGNALMQFGQGLMG